MHAQYLEATIMHAGSIFKLHIDTAPIYVAYQIKGGQKIRDNEVLKLQTNINT